MRNILLLYAHFPHHHSIWKASSSSLSNMTNLPHLWFLHSLSSSPQGESCVCTQQCFGLLCLFFFFNCNMCILLCIYNKDTWFYLSFWLCYSHITERNLHSCPASVFHYTLSCWLSVSLKDTWASWYKHKKSAKSEKERGRVGWKSQINRASHDFTDAQRSPAL